MNYQVARVKQSFEQVCIFPLILLGKIIGTLYPLKNKDGYFLIYTNRDRGGSYKVNADIAALIKDRKPLLIFTKHEKNGAFRSLYEMNGIQILDISRQIDHKLFHFLNIIWRGIIAASINKNKRPVVFGGECIYFYKLLPHLKKRSICIELCHVNVWFNYSQAFIPFIDKRVFSTQKIKRDAEAQYSQNKVPVKFLSNLLFIDNKVAIPEENWQCNAHLKILFVGRGAPQKRVYLVAEIAKRINLLKPQIHFTFIGDVDELIPADVKPLVTIRTDVNKPDLLQSFYRNNDVLILTSLFEGLPIVVMDMMAQGRVVLSTAVDGIPDYIKHLDNGLLINEILNEEALIKEAMQLICMLDDDKDLLKRLSVNARQFALAHFSSAVFDETYKEILHYY